jgi:hypothetical protein
MAGAKGIGVRVVAQVLPAPAEVQALDEVQMAAEQAGSLALEIGVAVVPRPLPEGSQNASFASHGIPRISPDFPGFSRTLIG